MCHIQELGSVSQYGWDFKYVGRSGRGYGASVQFEEGQTLSYRKLLKISSTKSP